LRISYVSNHAQSNADPSDRYVCVGKSQRGGLLLHQLPV
jgi:hypothetical protein